MGLLQHEEMQAPQNFYVHAHHTSLINAYIEGCVFIKPHWYYIHESITHPVPFLLLQEWSPLKLCGVLKNMFVWVFYYLRFRIYVWMMKQTNCS